MELDEYRKMYELEDSYWWFAGRRYLIRTLLQELDIKKDARILDAGCGTGAGLDNLSVSANAFGVDLSDAALSFCRKRGKKRLAASRLEQLAIRDESIEAVTILDVLEHVDDDRLVLTNLFRALKPGGKLLITVPAYPFLWSEHDEALHHRRRYRRQELRMKIEEVGFRIRSSSGLVSTLLGPIALFRLLQRVRDRLLPDRRGAPKTSFIVLPSPFNELLKRLLFLEVVISRRLPLPFGVTFYLVAEKPPFVNARESQSLLDRIAVEAPAAPSLARQREPQG